MRHFLSLLFAFVLLQTNAQTNEDILLITEARIALKNHDPKVAIVSLNKVSEQGKTNELFLKYSAEAYEALNEFNTSLYYYELYVTKTKLTPDLAEKIATLRYRFKKDSSLVADKYKKLFDNISSVYKASTTSNLKGNIKNQIKIVQEFLDVKIYDYDYPDRLLFEGRRSSLDSSIIMGTWHYVHVKDYVEVGKKDISINIEIPKEGDKVIFTFPYVGYRMKKGQVTAGILSGLAGEKYEPEYELYIDATIKSTYTYIRNK